MRAKEWLIVILSLKTLVLSIGQINNIPFFLEYFKCMYKYIYVFVRVSSDVTDIFFVERVFENGFDCLI